MNERGREHRRVGESRRPPSPSLHRAVRLASIRSRSRAMAATSHRRLSSAQLGGAWPRGRAFRRRVHAGTVIRWLGSKTGAGPLRSSSTLSVPSTRRRTQCVPAGDAVGKHEHQRIAWRAARGQRVGLDGVEQQGGALLEAHLRARRQRDRHARRRPPRRRCRRQAERGSAAMTGSAPSSAAWRWSRADRARPSA